MTLPVSFAREAERIRWRVEVMRLPGGVDWLCEQVRRLKHQERALGPDLGSPP